MHHYLHYVIQTGPENAWKTNSCSAAIKKKTLFLPKKTESRESFDEGRACKILNSVDLKAPIFKCYFQLTFPARV